MNHLNYKHLGYFYMVAKTSSIQAAAEQLNLTPQTISGQLKLLEAQLNEVLLKKSGRGMALTDAGQVVYEYCKDIFRLGDELQEVMQQNLTPKSLEWKVGIVDALPKSIAHQLLAPVLKTLGKLCISL